MSVMNKPDYKIFAQDAKSGELVTFPNILRGWGITLEQYKGFPPMELFNSAGKRVDEWLMYLTQRGLAEWDSTVDYPKDALVQYSSVFYVALKVTKGEQPNTSQNVWKPLVDFLGVNNKLDKAAIVQSTGTSTTSVMSQKASTDAFQPVGNYQPAGNYALKGESYTKSESNSYYPLKSDVYSKSATDSYLNKKFDKENVSQQLDNDVNKVPSLDLVAKELGKKQASGNYADKSTSTTQSFNSPITAMKELMAKDGNVSLGIKTVGKPEVVFNFGTVWRTLSFQDKDGVTALVGDSYTKSDSDNLYQPKGSYQPTGNYALKGESYTKSESDNRYPLKSDVYSKLASDDKYGLKNTANKSESGWWKCGDTGLIYQWGKVSGSTSETDTRNFPIKFPNKCLIMFGAYIGNDWGGGVGCVIKSSSTFLQINHTANASWSGAESNFLAIGY